MDLDALLREKRKRDGVLSAAHPAQRAAIEDPSRQKAVLTPRRGGKTYTCMIDAAHDQATHPGSLYFFIALTRPSAERIAWPIIRTLDRDFGLGCHYQEGKLRIRFPNDAQIYFVGADQSDWMERLRGVKARRVYIDEAAFYRINLKKFAEETIAPSLMDEGGTLMMVSTPGDICSGYYYDITTGREPGWTLHKWSTLENPHLAKQHQEALDKKKAAGVDIERDPGTRREYFGEWVEDEKGRVYLIGDIIEDYKPDWTVDHPVLAVDFGYKEDQTSFTLGVYSDAHPDFVVLESWKKEKLLLPDIAEEIREYERKNPGLVVLGDYSSGQLVDELRTRFNIRIHNAEKSDKPNWIKLYNSDSATKAVKIVAKNCTQLLEEQKALQKHVKHSGQWTEWPGQANDCCDSCLYAYRYSYHFRFSPKISGPAPGTPEYFEKEIAEYWEEEADRMETNRRIR